MNRSAIWIFAVLVAGAVAVGASEGWEIGECPENPQNIRRPACPADRQFTGGSCQSGPNWLGHMSICRLEDCAVCREDQMLDLEHGLCCDVPY